MGVRIVKTIPDKSFVTPVWDLLVLSPGTFSEITEASEANEASQASAASEASEARALKTQR